MFFSIEKKDKDTRARVGKIETPHGIVETPSYVVVGTNAAVRCVPPEELPETKTQMIISNTYHLWRSLGDEGLESYQGLHAEMDWQGPIMTDSGGFQVFSFGAAREHAVGKKDHRVPQNIQGEDSKVRVTEAGVYFDDNGEECYLDAELSMKIQEQLGADIIFAFDEPSSPKHDKGYTRLAMERTHRWAERCLESKESKQAIYGIVQGGAYEDLRKESAKVIGEMPFDGFGIGGAFGDSFGDSKEDSYKELDWTIPYLPENKPRHFLGMGRVDDLFYGVEAGIDTFDCVIPTREARHGGIWTSKGRFDVQRGIFKGDDAPLDSECGCPTCLHNGITRGALHEMFKEKDPRALTYATIHNIYFFNDLMEKIREAIKNGNLKELKRQYLGQ